MEMTNANALRTIKETGKVGNVELAQLRSMEGRNLTLSNGDKVEIVKVNRKGVSLSDGTLMSFRNIRAVGRGFKVRGSETKKEAKTTTNTTKASANAETLVSRLESIILEEGGFTLKHTRDEWYVIRLLAYRAVGFRKKALRDDCPLIVAEAEKALL